jgi:hypothetical protein
MITFVDLESYQNKHKYRGNPNATRYPINCGPIDPEIPGSLCEQKEESRQTARMKQQRITNKNEHRTV